jgi:DNA-binding response OmpR family regulator
VTIAPHGITTTATVNRETDLYRRRLIAAIDHDADVRQMVQQELAKAGYRTFAIEKTEPALEAFDEVHIDGLIVDLLLPGMSGLLLMRRGFQLNTIALLSKPFQIDHFTAKVEELLRSSEKTF